jgi:hypothetical protein
VKNKCSSLFLYVFISGLWFASQVLYFPTEEQSLWLQVWSSAHWILRSVQYLLFVFNFMLLYIYLYSTDTSYQRCTPVLDMCQCWTCVSIELYHLLKILSMLKCHVSVCLCQCFIEIFTFTCFQFRNNFPKMFSHCSFDITLFPFIFVKTIKKKCNLVHD